MSFSPYRCSTVVVLLDYYINLVFIFKVVEFSTWENNTTSIDTLCLSTVIALEYVMAAYVWCSALPGTANTTPHPTPPHLTPPHSHPSKFTSPSVLLAWGSVFFWGRGRSMLTLWCNHLRNKISISSLQCGGVIKDLLFQQEQLRRFGVKDGESRKSSQKGSDSREKFTQFKNVNM